MSGPDISMRMLRTSTVTVAATLLATVLASGTARLPSSSRASFEPVLVVLDELVEVVPLDEFADASFARLGVLDEGREVVDEVS